MRIRNRSVFDRLRKQWRRLASAPLVVWDIGAVTTRVHVGQKLVFSQSSSVAVSYATGRVVASGDDAYRLLGNTGRQLSVVFPVDRGCVTDTAVCTSWLTAIRSQLWPRRRWLTGLRTPVGQLCLAVGVGQADQDIWLTTLQNAGLSTIKPVSSLVGLSWYLNAGQEHEPLFVMDLGGSQTQLGIVVRGELYRSQAIGWGGLDVTTQIQAWVLRQYHCQISWLTAERLKCQAGSLKANTGGDRSVMVTGKDPYTQLGLSVAIDKAKLRSLLIESMADLVLVTQQFLASVPAEMATKSLERGLWLTGGHAQLHGLDRWLGEALHIVVRVVNDPLHAVSRGVAIRAAALAARSS